MTPDKGSMVRTMKKLQIQQLVFRMNRLIILYYGADEVRLEMLAMAGEMGVNWTRRLLNVCMQEGRVPM